MAASKKKALITGVTGQDGSYLVELLLEKDYEVHGFARRNTKDIPGVKLHYGDLADPAALRQALKEAEPDEVYNLGAQSHVGASFLDPVHTTRVTYEPLLTILEVARGTKTRVYQASSSEMFGDAPPPQNERSPFQPRSPYAIAKVAAHQLVRMHREAYGTFAVGGILHNHECVTAETPVIIRQRGMIDIVPIEELVPHREDLDSGRSKYTTEPQEPLEVWDRDGWTKVHCMTATRAKSRDVVRLHARAALVTATPDHIVFVGGDGQEREAGQVEEGHCLTLGSVPSAPEQTVVTEDEAWLLGALVADGWVGKDGHHARFTNNDDELRAAVAVAWSRAVGGWVTEGETSSGFSEGKVKAITLNGVSAFYKQALHEEIYTERDFKKVPRRILNSDAKTQLAFLRGYNAGDGLKEGHGTNEFKSWKTNSPTLAAGLWWMAQTVLKQRTILCIEDRDEATYYTINLNVPESMNRSSKGLNWRRPLDEVVKKRVSQYTGWLFDFATESGTFHAGVGQAWIHNSPRRPPSFVTRKITQGVARIFRGEATELVLGNLDAKRDWSFAGDMVKGMWLMLQQVNPRDYVLASGASHSVQEFVAAAFTAANKATGRALSWRDYVRTDPRFLRPAEVPYLLGNATRACEELGWRPEVNFEALVRMMVEWDLNVTR